MSIISVEGDTRRTVLFDFDGSYGIIVNIEWVVKCAWVYSSVPYVNMKCCETREMKTLNFSGFLRGWTMRIKVRTSCYYVLLK